MQDCYWLARANDSPEAGGEGEAGTRDPGHCSPPNHLSSRDRETGRGRPLAAVLPGGRKHRGRLGEEKVMEGERSNTIISINLHSRVAVGKKRCITTMN